MSRSSENPTLYPIYPLSSRTQPWNPLIPTFLENDHLSQLFNRHRPLCRLTEIDALDIMKESK